MVENFELNNLLANEIEFKSRGEQKSAKQLIKADMRQLDNQQRQ